MNDFEKRKLKLLQDIAKVSNAIDDDIDSFLAYSKTKNPSRKEILKKIHIKKQSKLKRLANRMKKYYV